MAENLETAAPVPVQEVAEAFDRQSMYTYSGKIAGLGSAEIVMFDDNGNEYYDC